MDVDERVRQLEATVATLTESAEMLASLVKSLTLYRTMHQGKHELYVDQPHWFRTAFVSALDHRPLVRGDKRLQRDAPTTTGRGPTDTSVKWA